MGTLERLGDCAGGVGRKDGGGGCLSTKRRALAAIIYLAMLTGCLSSDLLQLPYKLKVSNWKQAN